MCITATVLAAAAVVSAGVGAYSSIQSANANAANVAYRSRLEQKQLDEQRRSAEIEALQMENARTDEFERARSSALAAIGASGIGEHISFFRGIDPAAQDAFLQDVRNVRLNLSQTRATIADQVQVSGFASRIAKHNAGLSKIGAVADFMQTAMGAASFYNSYRPGRAAPAGG